jgi:hypothetical protein
VSEPDEGLRRLVAAEHGLDPKAAKFLACSTLEELERSAHALAKLVAARAEPERAEPAGLFSAAAREKARRQRALVGALHGRPRHQHDERGRFAAGSASFDGGARTPLPEPESHDEWLTRLLVEAHRDSGRW